MSFGSGFLALVASGAIGQEQDKGQDLLTCQTGSFVLRLRSVERFVVLGKANRSLFLKAGRGHAFRRAAIKNANQERPPLSLSSIRLECNSLPPSFRSSASQLCIFGT